jgi:hypothetical protein
VRLSRWSLACAAVAATTVIAAYCAATPPPASARIIPEGACKAIGDLNGLGGKACDALSNPGRLLKTGKSLITGHIGSAIKDLLGGGGSSASAALSLAAVVAWVYGGAKAALNGMSKVVNETSAPQLGSVWFSSTYWRMAAVAALLTLPFLFAAAVQALMRSDLSLLARAAFGHLPMALVGVGIAAPVTMLLLSGTDELCSLVWSPSSTNGLATALAGGGLIRVVGFVDSPFLAFLLCVFTAAAGMVVWLELAMREAAVYIVVLMLPLAFAALVWPARRVWALRSVEMLVALILSKFAIVAVLGLGGTALDQSGTHGLGAMLAGMVLVLLAAFAPWAVLRLVPLAEVASTAAGSLRSHVTAARDTARTAGRIRDADDALWGVASHIANLARSSGSGRGAGSAASNGSSHNGGQKADRAPFNWDDEALQSAAHPQEGRQDENDANSGHADAPDRAGLAIDSEDADLAPDAGGASLATNASGADLSSHIDRSDLAAGGLAGAGGASAFGHSAESGRSAEFGHSAGEERVPGADPLWQAPDMSWPTVPLGLYDGWPPDPPWPAEDPRWLAEDADPQRSSEDAPTGSGGQSPPGARPPLGAEAGAGTTPAGAEQSDPLPPEPDREGSL